MSAVALHHVIDGPADAPPVVLVGSLGTTGAVWEPQLPALAGLYRVIRVDLRGHGGSPVPPAPYDMADLGGDVVALLDRLGLERASYVGLSIGGMVGLWLGAHAPERIDRLALLCTTAYSPKTADWHERAAAVRAARSAEAVADAVVGRWLTPAYAAAHPETRAWLRAMVVATPFEGYAACAEAIARMDQRDDLASISAPTLVVGGAEDPSTPPDQQRAIAAAIPDARLEILPAAHVATVECADAVTALLLEHLGAGR